MFSQASYLGGYKDNTTSTANQYDRCVKTGIQQRAGRQINKTAANVNGLFGTTAVIIVAIISTEKQLDTHL